MANRLLEHDQRGLLISRCTPYIIAGFIFLFPLWLIFTIEMKPKTKKALKIAGGAFLGTMAVIGAASIAHDKHKRSTRIRRSEERSQRGYDRVMRILQKGGGNSWREFHDAATWEDDHEHKSGSGFHRSTPDIAATRLNETLTMNREW